MSYFGKPHIFGEPLGLLMRGGGVTVAELSAPANDTVLADWTPTFTWSAVSGADTYEIQIASDAAFTSIEDTDATVATNSYTPAALDNTVPDFYWRVRTKTPDEGAWSDTFRFSLWTVSDDFTVDDAAPVADPLNADGVGVWDVVDTEEKFSISGGNLNYSPKASPAWGDPTLWENGGLARGAGVTLLYQIQFSAAALAILGWTTAKNGTLANVNGLYYQGSGVLHTFDNSGQKNVYGVGSSGVLSADTTYTVASVLRTAGALHFIRGGVFTDWTLLWADWLNSATPLFAGLYLRDITGVMTFAKIRYIGSGFASDFGLAVVDDESIVATDTFSGAANHLTHLTFTLPGVPSANEEGAVLITRRQDANNYWKSYIKRNAGDTAWDFLVDSVVDGTPTNRLTVTGVGTPTRMIVKQLGNFHDFWTVVTTTVTKRGSQLDNATLAAQSGMAVDGTGTLSRLTAWAENSDAYGDELDR